MKQNLSFILILVFLSSIIISGCTTTVGPLPVDDKPIANIEQECESAINLEKCYNYLAGYNNDVAVCDKIQDENIKNECKASFQGGQLMFREHSVGFVLGLSCSNDFKDFNQKCQNKCTEKNLQYKDPTIALQQKTASSVNGRFSCNQVGTESKMKVEKYAACYCY